jgi:hypothetical protein
MASEALALQRFGRQFVATNAEDIFHHHGENAGAHGVKLIARPAARHARATLLLNIHAYDDSKHHNNISFTVRNSEFAVSCFR